MQRIKALNLGLNLLGEKFYNYFYTHLPHCGYINQFQTKPKRMVKSL
jgi:hypothetical protein